MSEYDVFISYETRTGTSYAENLKEALEKNKKHVCFLAGLSINKGDEWRKKIYEALAECKYFVVIITSLTPESEEVEKEYKKATELGKRIIFCKWKYISYSEIAHFSYFQQIEFEDKYELANKVVQEIKNIEKKEREGISVSEDVEEFLNRGNLLMNLRKYEEAEKKYREAIRINPNYAEVHNNLGVLLVNLNRFDEAEKEFRVTIKINPNYAEAHNNLGNLLVNLNHYEEAEKEYRVAIRINPNYAEAHNT